jgi:hypothetical protein
LTGFAFVSSSVTARGGRARLPRGTKISKPGSKITGTTGCPTNQYQTDGLLVVVIDYNGRPTAASVTVTSKLAGSSQSFTRAPYYIDLNAGRTIQYLGPIFQNGTYSVVLQWAFNGPRGQSVSGKLVLARHCRFAG